MLTWLAELSPYFSPLNVFRYITFRTGGATATALLFVFLFGPPIISLLRLKQGKGQPIREDGPQSHLLTKRGTPTMGGLMILAGVLVSTLLWANLANHYVWVVAARHRRLRRDRLLRRLSQGHEAVAQGLLRPLAPCPRGADRRHRLHRDLVHGDARPRQQARAALLEGPDLQSRLVLRRLRRLRDRRRRQRREPHRRPRRPRHRAGDDRRRHVRLHRLPGRQRGVRELSADPLRARHRRARGDLRRA